MEVRRGEGNMRKIKAIISQLDADGNGVITREEVKAYRERPEMLEALGISAAELCTAHATLDAGDTGEVDIEELVVSVLRLRGQAPSKSDEMLILDLQQQVLLRNVVAVDREGQEHWTKLGDSTDRVIRHTKNLSVALGALRKDVDGAKEELLKELAREEVRFRQSRREQWEARFIREAKLQDERDQLRHTLANRVEELQARVEQLQQARRFSAACSAGARGKVALRRAVRKRLDAGVAPWLRSHFAQLQEGGPAPGASAAAEG